MTGRMGTVLTRAIHMGTGMIYISGPSRDIYPAYAPTETSMTPLISYSGFETRPKGAARRLISSLFIFFFIYFFI